LCEWRDAPVDLLFHAADSLTQAFPLVQKFFQQKPMMLANLARQRQP